MISMVVDSPQQDERTAQLFQTLLNPSYKYTEFAPEDQKRLRACQDVVLQRITAVDPRYVDIRVSANLTTTPQMVESLSHDFVKKFVGKVQWHSIQECNGIIDLWESKHNTPIPLDPSDVWRLTHYRDHVQND